MDAATEARIVDIGLPLSNGGYSYFSGYVISDGLILTCLHGFKGNYDSSIDNLEESLEYDPSQKISICSSGFDTEINLDASCFDELAEGAFFAYFSDEFSEKYDVVIFNCAEAKAPYQQKIQLANLNTPDDWLAGGFPFFNRATTETGGYCNFHGKFNAPSSTAVNLVLNVATPLPNMKDWGCASGSPVFIKERLAGVLRRFTRYESENDKYVVIPNQLEASYLKKLWEEDPNFKAFFELQDPTHKIIKHVVSFLTDSSCSGLRSVMGEDSPENLVARLQSSPLANFLDEMDGVTNTSIETKKGFTNSFVPFYFSDYALLIEQTMSSPTVDIACVKEIAAEYAMSAFSGREANVAYRGDATTRSGELYVSEGKQALAAMPESGIGHIGLDKAALAEDFKRRRALPDILIDKERLSIQSTSLEKFVVSRLANYMEGGHETDAIDEVNAVLEEDSRKNIHYYMVVKIDKSSDSGKQALGLIESYKSTFPGLIFINLTPSGRMDERERLLHRKLPGIIT